MLLIPPHSNKSAKAKKTKTLCLQHTLDFQLAENTLVYGKVYIAALHLYAE